MSWDAGFTGGLQNMPPPEAGMSLWEYLSMLIVAVAVTCVRQVLEVVAKTIPDDATGGQAIVREICKALSGYTKNKEHADDKPEYLGEPKDPPKP